ncbi:dihydrofolate reductase [Patescibacteria group bacterium]|nr:dihydrofolate reductase [Patescibacteria group bacterium]MCL5797901.1 dihydrofolate reductase [Patescibacteria group bacterium]
MNSVRVSIIAAIGENRELGRENKLLWRIPDDLKRFKELTRGHPVIMGRTTYQSIGRPLPNRTNIIVSRDVSLKLAQCLVVSSVEAALQKAKETGSKEIFIIGGGQIYKQTINLADRLYLTVVQGRYPTADTFFPDYSRFAKIVAKSEGLHNNYHYTFLTLEPSE